MVVDDQHVEPAAQRLDLRERLFAASGLARLEAGRAQQQGGGAPHGFVIVDVQDQATAGGFGSVAERHWRVGLTWSAPRARCTFGLSERVFARATNPSIRTIPTRNVRRVE